MGRPFLRFFTTVSRYLVTRGPTIGRSSSFLALIFRVLRRRWFIVVSPAYPLGTVFRGESGSNLCFKRVNPPPLLLKWVHVNAEVIVWFSLFPRLGARLCFYGKSYNDYAIDTKVLS